MRTVKSGAVVQHRTDFSFNVLPDATVNRLANGGTYPLLITTVDMHENQAAVRSLSLAAQGIACNFLTVVVADAAIGIAYLVEGLACKVIDHEHQMRGAGFFSARPKTLPSRSA